MEESSNQPDERPAIICGQCGQAIEPNDGEQAHCPHCGAELPSPQWVEPDAPPAEEQATTDAEDELSGLRIRQISALRRAADRARSYCLIGLIVLVVGAGELVMMTVRDVSGFGWHPLQLGYAAGAVAGLIFAWRLGKRAIELTRELKKPLLSDPLQPPDFSTLNDGSQHVRHLEEM